MSTLLDKTRDRNRAGDTRKAETETEEFKERLELLYEVAEQASSISEVSKLIEEILQATQHILQASASSLFLIDQEKRQLYVQAAGGKAENVLRQMRLDIDSGIAGWVARNGEPVVANDVTEDERFNKDIDIVSGFVTRSLIAVPVVRGQKAVGVIEVLNKSDGSMFNERDLRVLTGLASTEALILLTSMAAMAIHNIKVRQIVLDGYKSTVETLVSAADAKDPYAYGHSRRVKEYALLAANSLSLSPEELQVVEFGALLHDIGKIGIDDSILRKPGPLTDEEWYIVRKHPFKGANIVGEIPFLKKAKDLVLNHHERYDGKGYPEGLKGEKIPLIARLVAVADAFDTMTTNHSYRAALSIDEAISELSNGIGTQFCPVGVEAFISGFKKNKGDVLKKEAQRVAEEMDKRETEEVIKAKEAEEAAIKEAEEAVKDIAKREAEEARKAREVEKKTRKEAEQAVKDIARKETEEARKAKESKEKLAKKEAQRAAREKAKKEAEEAKKAKESKEKLAKKKAERVAKEKAKKEAERVAKEKAKREAEEARKARETEEKLAKKEAEQEDTKKAWKDNEPVTVFDDTGPEVYEGEVQLAVESPAGFKQIRQFKESLKKVKDLKIVMDSWSEKEGTIIDISLQKPMALSRILRKIPAVEQVDETGNNVLVVLKNTPVD